MKVVLRVVELVGSSELPGPDPAGLFIASYDPEAFGGRGDVSLTPDPAKALVFDSFDDAMQAYRARSKSRPVRPDGRPNRPLTAFTVQVVPAPKEAV